MKWDHKWEAALFKHEGIRKQRASIRVLERRPEKEVGMKFVSLRLLAFSSPPAPIGCSFRGGMQSWRAVFTFQKPGAQTPADSKHIYVNTNIYCGFHFPSRHGGFLWNMRLKGEWKQTNLLHRLLYFTSRQQKGRKALVKNLDGGTHFLNIFNISWFVITSWCPALNLCYYAGLVFFKGNQINFRKYQNTKIWLLLKYIPNFIFHAK